MLHEILRRFFSVGIRRFGLCIAIFPAFLILGAHKDSPLLVMANGYYFRESVDREWHLRFIGEIPSLCGAYLILHDSQGKAIYHGTIPHGKYPEEKPFTITIPPDGKTGDYRLVIIGHQRDYLGIRLPLSDLPLEVYGGNNFAVGHEVKAPVYFKVPQNVNKMKLGAYKGHLRVLRAGGEVMADTQKSGTTEKYNNVVTFNVSPDETYLLERSCFYFRSEPELYLVFDPARWFAPDPELNKVKWWEVAKP